MTSGNSAGIWQNGGIPEDAVSREIAEREPEFKRYIAPQKEHADAVIEIGYSEYGRALGKDRNVYCVSLSQHRMKQTIENIDLSLDLYSSCPSRRETLP